LGITTENTRIDDILETSTISAASTMSLTMPRIGLQRHVSSSWSVVESKYFRQPQVVVAVGDYNCLAKAVGEEETVLPEEVHNKMKTLLTNYYSLKHSDFDAILDFHVRFERIHPF